MTGGRRHQGSAQNFRGRLGSHVLKSTVCGPSRRGRRALSLATGDMWACPCRMVLGLAYLAVGFDDAAHVALTLSARGLATLLAVVCSADGLPVVVVVAHPGAMRVMRSFLGTGGRGVA